MGTAGGDAGSAELKSSTVALADTDPADDKKQDESKDGRKDDDAKKDTASDKPFITLKELGKPVSADESGAESPALVGTATGRFAPGWTAQQTTTVSVGGARGLLGMTCTAPDTSFWFPGASTDKTRQDYVHLTNPDDTAAVADIELYGKDGALKSEAGEGIPVPARSSVPVLLSTLTSENAENATVHVSTRTGRVGAAVRAADDGTGSDWLSSAADPAGSLVLPGIPADATDVRLVAFAPGADDADLKVQLAGPDSTIAPAAWRHAARQVEDDRGTRPEGRHQGGGGFAGAHSGAERARDADRRGAARGPGQGRGEGGRVHPGDRPGLVAGECGRQPGQGLDALPDRARRDGEGQGHGLGRERRG